MSTGHFFFISIHVLREEDDFCERRALGQIEDFNPRPPRGGRRTDPDDGACQPAISIHVLREEDDLGRTDVAVTNKISIHVLREEDDATLDGSKKGVINISIHVLREEDDSFLSAYADERRIFQSTSSARRTTSQHLPKNSARLKISIHVLREEDDCTDSAARALPAYFNPRPPRGGRPPPAAWFWDFPQYFNPRPPRGGRLALGSLLQSLARHFNPRPPRGGRPGGSAVSGWRDPISIHVLREEDDQRIRTGVFDYFDFNPRPPRGGRHRLQYMSNTEKLFQSTSSARRTTAHSQQVSCGCINFNPRPPRGGRPGSH